MKPIDPYEALEAIEKMLGPYENGCRSCKKTWVVLQEAKEARPAREQAIAELVEAAKRAIKEEDLYGVAECDDLRAALAAMEDNNG